MVLNSDISTWKKIGFVYGHGSSTSPINYSFEDKNLTAGTDFTYRLKQIDYSGNFEYSKEIEIKITPAEISLYQNYPNPFNPVTDIKFTLPKDARVTLKIYNIIGEEVTSLINGFEKAGFHNVQFNGSNLASGTYFYRLQTGNYIQTRKMILLK